MIVSGGDSKLLVVALEKYCVKACVMTTAKVVVSVDDRLTAVQTKSKNLVDRLDPFGPGASADMEQMAPQRYFAFSASQASETLRRDSPGRTVFESLERLESASSNPNAASILCEEEVNRSWQSSSTRTTTGGSFCPVNAARASIEGNRKYAPSCAFCPADLVFRLPIKSVSNQPHV